ncbi:MAG: hypothetical protein IJ458_04205 [Clostridia bacterium]|nr:hypothetical protein [Clostridia bacterium]
MRYDIVRQKRRYEMLDKGSKNEVLNLIDFFGRYQLRNDGKIYKQYIYYDTDNLDLYKSGIALFRTIINGKHTLTMTLERLYNEGLQPYSKKHNELHLDARDSIFDYPEFLRNSFKNMWDGFLNIDPDYLLKKLSLTYTIETTSHEYKLINGTGLKATLSFDSDKYIDHRTNRKANSLFLTVYQHSREDTNDEYENLLSKIERYCKSLTHINKTKVDLARAKTKLIVKEEKKEKKKKGLFE